MRLQLKMIALAALAVVQTSTVLAQQRTEKITVSGNCGMCEKKIEAAAKDAGAKKS